MVNKVKIFFDESHLYTPDLVEKSRQTGGSRFLRMMSEIIAPPEKPKHGWYRKFEKNDKRPENGCTKKRR